MTGILSTLSMAEIRAYDTRPATKPVYMRAGMPAVYIFEFEGGIVKVGQTGDVPTRRSAHCSDKRTRGLKLINEWIQPTPSALEDEKTILTLAHELGGVPFSGREWFTGLNAVMLMIAAEVVLIGRRSEMRAA